jgi:hypothetical protein
MGYDETLRIWNFDTYVDDPEEFMEKYMGQIMAVINNDEPLTTFGWPLFLPVCIAPRLLHPVDRGPDAADNHCSEKQKAQHRNK